MIRARFGAKIAWVKEVCQNAEPSRTSESASDSSSDALKLSRRAKLENVRFSVLRKSRSSESQTRKHASYPVP